MEKKKRRSPFRRWTARIARLMLFALAVALLWYYLEPKLTADASNRYISYTAETGDVETTMDFSGSVNVKSSETITAGTEAEIREIYVAEEQTVEKDAKLLRLSNGTVIRAGIAGTINAVNVNVGDSVRNDTSLVEIVDYSTLSATLRVDEYDINSLSVSQPCSVTIMSLGLTFDSTLTHISYISASPGSVAYYTATADISVSEDVLPGMQVCVTIPQQTKKGVVTLPVEAVSFDTDGAYVWMKTADGQMERRALETGLSDGIRVEITSGLNVGEEVFAIDNAQEEESRSLIALLSSLLGEKTVINDTASAGFMNMGSDGTMPDFAGELPEGGFTQEQDSVGSVDSEDTSVGSSGVQQPSQAPAAAQATLAPDSGDASADDGEDFPASFKDASDNDASARSGNDGAFQGIVPDSSAMPSGQMLAPPAQSSAGENGVSSTAPAQTQDASAAAQPAQ